MKERDKEEVCFSKGVTGAEPLYPCFLNTDREGLGVSLACYGDNPLCFSGKRNVKVKALVIHLRVVFVPVPCTQVSIPLPSFHLLVPSL